MTHLARDGRRNPSYGDEMDDQQQQAIHQAVDAALDELAERLGGTSETGGPVENATQIKGRGDLGILLTDASDRVLGRVWVAFGAGLQTSDPLVGGAVEIQAEVCSELIDPPVSVDDWMASLQLDG
ncbi:MAG: hypothetical protein ABW352_15950 [Polyangiales bacterium]